MDAILQLLSDHRGLLTWTAGASVLMLVGTAVVVPILLTNMRPDYFADEEPPPDRWTTRHGVFGVLLRVLKNLGGVLLLLVGLAMLVLPGQGILTVLMALALLDFPRKRRVERWIIRRRGVRSAINWIRARSERPPIVLDHDASSRRAPPSETNDAEDRAR